MEGDDALIEVVRATRDESAAAVAAEIAGLARRGRLVLGLATGRSPVEIYAELVRLRREQSLDFTRVTAFGLDEYLGLVRDDPRSCGAYLRLFVLSPLGIARSHLLSPDLAEGELERHCRDYERAIDDAGGIDLQLLGVGRNGHIGFNEPGSPRDSRTREVRLARETREDAALAFGGIERVPEHAVTQGVATILRARRIRVLAFGERKHHVVRRALEGPADAALPVSFLREHADVRLYTDG